MYPEKKLQAQLRIRLYILKYQQYVQTWKYYENQNDQQLMKNRIDNSAHSTVITW
jgi:hypothetical protein